MASNKGEKNTHWVDDAIKHLATLLKEATELADENDVLPTTETLSKGREVLQTYSHASAPKLGMTTDGDFVFISFLLLFGL